MKHRVLFVCLGNICRSPTAHGIFEHKVRQAGAEDRVDIESAGTGAWHVGKGPDPRAREAARRRGYDMDALRARQVDPSDFERFDYILAMDQNNLDELQLMAPSSYDGHLGLFLAFGDWPEVQEVPDPYYGGDQGFEYVLDLVENACDGLLDHLLERR